MEGKSGILKQTDLMAAAMIAVAALFGHQAAAGNLNLAQSPLGHHSGVKE
jgi:hypothetical protein